jgi:nicotinate-nucleotide adenylyltransferase
MAITKPIGILGGTFDPIHLGHLHLAKACYLKCELATIYFVPCFQSPLRNKPLISATHRLAMVQLALQKYPEFHAYDGEILAANKSYTINTLQSFRKELGTQTPICLILGTDVFNSFTMWHSWQKILEHAHLIVVNRPEIKIALHPPLDNIVAKRLITAATQLQDAPYGAILFVDINPLPISATQIRQIISAGANAQNYLPKNVWDYIVSHNLYRDN